MPSNSVESISTSTVSNFGELMIVGINVIGGFEQSESLSVGTVGVIDANIIVVRLFINDIQQENNMSTFRSLDPCLYKISILKFLNNRADLTREIVLIASANINKIIKCRRK